MHIIHLQLPEAFFFNRTRQQLFLCIVFISFRHTFLYFFPSSFQSSIFTCLSSSFIKTLTFKTVSSKSRDLTYTPSRFDTALRQKRAFHLYFLKVLFGFRNLYPDKNHLFAIYCHFAGIHYINNLFICFVQ